MKKPERSAETGARGRIHHLHRDLRKTRVAREVREAEIPGGTADPVRETRRRAARAWVSGFDGDLESGPAAVTKMPGRRFPDPLTVEVASPGTGKDAEGKGGSGRGSCAANVGPPHCVRFVIAITSPGATETAGSSATV